MFNWAIFILVILTLIILVSLYLNGYFQVRKPYNFTNFPASTHPYFGTTVAGLSDSWISEGRIKDFWIGAKEIYQARFDAIKQAKSHIYFETYIMTPGDRADQFAEILQQKIKEKVKIYILVDSHGTKAIPKNYWQTLQQAGIKVRWYNPFDWRDPVKNLQRNHRKLLIVDDQIALIGGAGISDLWDGKDEAGSIEPWLDYEIAMKGAMIWRLKGLFWQHWLDAGGETDFTPMESHYKPDQSTEILITANENPSYQNSSIRALFQTLTLGATERLWLASPYFLPNDNSCRMLIEACQRGVDIKVLTMGKRCDKPFVRKAAYERYNQLIKGGISLYEYQPSMMHAKLVIMDDTWLTFGSANFDPRSLFQNDELNLTIKDHHQQLFSKIETFFEQAFSKSQLVTLSQWRKRKVSDRLIGRFWLLFFWQL
jgi:cardiolipin synthase